MGSLLAGLWSALKGLVTSKKVLTAIGTAIAGVVIKDPAVRGQVVQLGTALLVGQGMADFGKAKTPPTPPSGG